MGTVLGRVLVIDDDPFMLKVITDLLEKAGYNVITRDSPTGATQVLVGERVDAAVIDWNLPGLQGDAVIRLLRTWEEVRDLPVLLITGAPNDTVETLREQLPGVRVLMKDDLRTQLVGALGSITGTNKTVRGLAPIKLGADGGAPRRKADELVPQLLSQLSETLERARSIWSEAAQGRRERLQLLTESLSLLAGQARLLALEEAASLLQALTDTLDALPGERKIPRDAKRAIDAGIEALTALADHGDGAFTIPPEPLIGALRKARSELPPPH
ncbi:MAG TPA: response regulator [Polyangiales bacterium]|nr:response regulator [Polyangiales bacterium]